MEDKKDLNNEAKTELPEDELENGSEISDRR